MCGSAHCARELSPHSERAVVPTPDQHLLRQVPVPGQQGLFKPQEKELQGPELHSLPRAERVPQHCHCLVRVLQGGHHIHP